jgi:CTP:molybdopterin cytidylyltransferase MocA
MVPAIVLAAGASSRMGRPKALLRMGDETFLRRILRVLRDAGLPDAVVIVRPGQDALAEEVAVAGFGRIVENPRADQGQLSSLIAGLDAVDRPDVDGALVTLVDVPGISTAVISALLERMRTSASPVVRAVHDGRHGHPVIFRRALFERLRQADPAVGAKAVLRTVAIEDVEVHEPGITEDVDTPADYERIRGMLSR